LFLRKLTFSTLIFWYNSNSSNAAAADDDDDEDDSQGVSSLTKVDTVIPTEAESFGALYYVLTEVSRSYGLHGSVITRSPTNPVDRWDKLLLGLASAVSVSGPVETLDYIFVIFITSTCFKMGPPL
jgi:hypothetical protein